MRNRGAGMADAHEELLRRAGARVRAARESAGMSQAQLAERIGLVRSSVSNLEAGRQDMTISRLAGIAAVLSLDLAELVTLGELPPPPHEVAIMAVLEVSCRTCGGLVLDVTRSRAEAQDSKAAHVAAMQEKDRDG